LIGEAQRALASADLETADRKLKAAGELTPGDPELADLRARVGQKRAAALQAAAAAAEKRTAPTPLARIEEANKSAPFVNTLGMKFVPVKITGGRSAGKTVLFSIFETRVSDFEKYADKNKFRPQPYQTTPDHPAVRIRPVYAVD